MVAETAAVSQLGTEAGAVVTVTEAAARGATASRLAASAMRAALRAALKMASIMVLSFPDSVGGVFIWGLKIQLRF